MTKEYNKLKVPELKKLLEERGLSTTGLKAVLVERLQSADKETEGASEKPVEKGKDVVNPTPKSERKKPAKRSSSPTPTQDEKPSSNKSSSAPSKTSPKKSPSPERRSPSPKKTPSPAKKTTSPAAKSSSPTEKSLSPKKSSSPQKSSSPERKSPSPAKRSPSPPKRSPSPPKRSPSPPKGSSSPHKRSPSPANKHTTPVKRSASPSPPTKRSLPRSRSPSPHAKRSPSPTNKVSKGSVSPKPETKKSSNKDPTEEESKKRKTATTSVSTTKRPRKWGTGGQEDINISSDVLDGMLIDSADEPPRTTPAPVRVADTPRREVAKKEALPEGEREVPPPRKPESRTLYIDRFVRPFLPKQARELLEKTGELEFFWMNNIKSICYATFKTVEQAKATREAIYNLVWPPANNSRLRAEFSTEEEAARHSENAKSRDTPIHPPPIPKQQQPQTTTITPISKTTEPVRTDKLPERERPTDRGYDRDRIGRDRDRDNRDNRERREDLRSRQPPPPPAPKVTLETLFRKTQARPCIYWLPLTEKEVLDKKNSSSVATKS